MVQTLDIQSSVAISKPNKFCSSNLTNTTVHSVQICSSLFS